MHFLFSDFLDRPEVYEACEQYRQRTVESLLQASPLSGPWMSLNAGRLSNGQLFELGNPIIDRFSPTLGRGFRIIQGSPVADRLFITALVKTYDGEIIPGVPLREELDVGLWLTEETAARACKLLTKWIDPDTSVAAMHAFIDEVTSDIKYPTLDEI